MTDKHEADLKRVNAENAYTDITRTGEHLPQGGGLFTTMVNGIVRTVAETNPNKKAVWGSTDFDGKDLALNQMLDLVEGTDPEDLESSGKALWDARDAIKEAADELNGHIDKVRWVGKSGSDFRTWGTHLVASTTELSKFAGDAGDQLATAAVGLASVRGSMPSRDTEANRKRPEHFTEAEKTANKDEYAAAVRVEKDRQEAINQMNRLASYYAVSGQELEGLQAPTFKSMPSVGVPRPEQQHWNPSGGSEGTGTTTPAIHHSVAPTGRTGTHDVSDTATPSKDITGSVTRPDEFVGTNIDSVGTLPPSTTAPVTGHAPPVTGTPPMGGGQPPMGEGLGNPIPNGMLGRNLNGTGGLRTPASAQGRSGAPGLTNSGSGRTAGQGAANQMGRATSTGQAAAKGLTAGSNSSQMGRGISGGTPRAGGTATPRAGSGPATGAGRANGVVGGRPAAGDASAKGGSRIPRGTVVGGEGAANSRSTTGRPGQRGVFGAGPESTARPGSRASSAPRGSAGTADAVTGRAAARNSAAGAERNGMTRGGAGLVRGPAQNGKPGEERNAQGTTRPDYLVEDEETHLPDKPRRDVPPVVN
ncbi:hypothetical protein ACFYRY_18690 [Streptomyces sp. NPDC005263]|uniref:hypothetical protein n=1 Tax=Streptomyces sp. NPDC005263 TaxID=3364711 RepID=UPI0036753B2D